METRLTMSTQELKRLQVVELIEAKHMTVAEGAGLLGISERQLWRIVGRYRQVGAGGLVHGNRNQPSPRRLAAAVRDEILALAAGRYRDYNDQHLTEVLQEERGLVVSRASVRRVRRAAGLSSPKKYRRRQGRQRRERYAQAGMLLQMDASLHLWLEDRGPRLALVGAIDDATNEVVSAHFREQEDAAGYFLLLQDIAVRYGLPLAIYADRHTIFQSPKQPTIEQVLADDVPRSQFARLLADLNIRLIAAHSPQAKGRIERLWQTFQDRLVKELRQAGATTLEEANQLLAGYLPKFNQRFMVPAAQPGTAFRPLPDDLDLALRFAFRYQRRVANDHTITLAGHKLQLPSLAHGRSYAKATVDLHHLLDGRLAVCYQGQWLATFDPAQPGPPRVEQFCPLPISMPLFPQPSAPAQPATETSQASLTSQASVAASDSPSSHKPPANHPWRRSYKDMKRATPITEPFPPHLAQGQSTDIFTEP
jgi:transposase